MADFAATGTSNSTGFAHTERWEVVVQVELLGEFRQQTVDDLLITTGTQGARNQGLGLAPLEQS